MNIIGFDVSKNTIDCNLLKNLENYHIKHDNSENGFLEIHRFIKKHKLRKVAIVMESTGIYYEASANYFSQYYDVYVINPLKIKEHSKKTFNRTKTDKADAKLIADFGFRYLDKLIKYKKPEPTQYRLNKLNVLQQQLKEEIKRHKNQIHASRDEFIIAIHADLIVELESKLETVNVQILNLIQSNSELNEHFNNLMTIPCMNHNTASVLLHFLGTKDFANANKFTAFAGLSPQIFESGISVKKPDKLTRLGHMRLKAVMFMPAFSAMRTKYFRDFVARLRQNGKKPKVIIVALMRKLLKLAYYIYKSKQAFDLNYQFK